MSSWTYCTWRYPQLRMRNIFVSPPGVQIVFASPLRAPSLFIFKHRRWEIWSNVMGTEMEVRQECSVRSSWWPVAGLRSLILGKGDGGNRYPRFVFVDIVWIRCEHTARFRISIRVRFDVDYQRGCWNTEQKIGNKKGGASACARIMSERRARFAATVPENRTPMFRYNRLRSLR